MFDEEKNENETIEVKQDNGSALVESSDSDKATIDVIQCPACETGQLRLRVGKFGKFWGCSNFPECKQTFKNAGTKPLMSAEDSDAI